MLYTSISIKIQIHSDRFITRFISLHQRCATSAQLTNKYFQIIGSIHDIESYFGIDNTSSLNVQIFFSHWGHLAIIFLWVSRNLFHIGWNGNYELWVKNPIATIPIAHGIWDPHFGLSISDAYSSGKSDSTIVLSYSGIYNWLYTFGFMKVNDLYNFVIICECVAVISIPLGKVHLIYLEDTLQWSWQSHRIVGFTLNLELLAAKDTDIKVGPIFIWPFKLFVAYFDLGNLRLNFHTGIIIGFLSIAWCGHLVHVAIPISRGMHLGGLTTQWSISLYPFYTGNWVLYSLDIVGAGSRKYMAASGPLRLAEACYACGSRKYQAILTFLGGYNL